MRGVHTWRTCFSLWKKYTGSLVNKACCRAATPTSWMNIPLLPWSWYRHSMASKKEHEPVAIAVRDPRSRNWPASQKVTSIVAIKSILMAWFMQVLGCLPAKNQQWLLCCGSGCNGFVAEWYAAKLGLLCCGVVQPNFVAEWYTVLLQSGMQLCGI